MSPKQVKSSIDCVNHDLSLVIDVGSSSVRALLFNADYQPIPDSMARREHSFQRGSAPPIQHLLAAISRRLY